MKPVDYFDDSLKGSEWLLLGVPILLLLIPGVEWVHLLFIYIAVVIGLLTYVYPVTVNAWVLNVVHYSKNADDSVCTRLTIEDWEKQVVGHVKEVTGYMTEIPLLCKRIEKNRKRLTSLYGEIAFPNRVISQKHFTQISNLEGQKKQLVDWLSVLDKYLSELERQLSVYHYLAQSKYRIGPCELDKLFVEFSLVINKGDVYFRNLSEVIANEDDWCN